MTEVTARPSTLAVAPRDITPSELAGLDRLRAALAGVVDRTSPRAVSWLWDRTLDANPDGPAPAGFVESVATALGDLLAVHVPTVRWSVWPGPDGPTLGVASLTRSHAPVLPFLDAQDRWQAGSRDWVVGYLARAAAHLAAAPALPRPHQPPDDLAADEPDVPPEPTVGAVPTPSVGAVSEPTAAAAPVDEVAAETPTREPTAPAESAAPVPGAADPAASGEPPATPPADEPLEDFAHDTLDHAMLLLQETGTFDREILVLLVGPGGRRAEVFAGDPVETLARAYAMVRASGARRAAVTWVERHPGYLPGAPQRFPAVVVDTWDAGEPGLRVAHRFVDDVLGTDPLGGTLVVGAVPALL